MAGKKTDKKTEKTDKKTSKKTNTIKEILKTGDKDKIYNTIKEQETTDTTPDIKALTKALNKKYTIRQARGIITFKDNTAKGHTWLQIQTEEDDWQNYDIKAATHGKKQGTVLGESYMIHEITPIE